MTENKDFDPRSEAARKCGEFPYFTARPINEVGHEQNRWPRCLVGVFQHNADGTEQQIGTYERNYSFLRTFWWLRRGTRHFALYSPDYTATRIMEILPDTGIKDIGGEEPSGGGFCPVEFFVPDCRKLEYEELAGPGKLITDWGDPYKSLPIGSEFKKATRTHTGRRRLRGPDGTPIAQEMTVKNNGVEQKVKAPSWGEEQEYESGWIKFPQHHGFVAGCVWGDDSSWKIQHLDISQIEDGIIHRDDRFGYVALPGTVLLRDAIRLFYPFENDEDAGDLEIAVSTVWEVNSGRMKSPEICAVQGHER